MKKCLKLSFREILAALPSRLTCLLAASLTLSPGLFAATAPDLNSAGDFGVLAGGGITITGATTIAGDIGTFPTATITGLENLTLTGTNHAGDGVTQVAKTDLLAAYLDAAGQTPTTTFGAIYDLGSQTLGAGVYNGPSSFGLTGTLTLDAMGDPNAVWIFQAGSTLITESGSNINLIGGAQAANVFWQVGSSATFGTGTQFVGSVLASDSITMTTGATIDGGLYALNGAVTLDTNIVQVPEPGGAVLLTVSLMAMMLTTRRRWK